MKPEASFRGAPGSRKRAQNRSSGAILKSDCEAISRKKIRWYRPGSNDRFVLFCLYGTKKWRQTNGYDYSERGGGCRS